MPHSRPRAHSDTHSHQKPCTLSVWELDEAGMHCFSSLQEVSHAKRLSKSSAYSESDGARSGAYIHIFIRTPSPPNGNEQIHNLLQVSGLTDQPYRLITLAFIDIKLPKKPPHPHNRTVTVPRTATRRSRRRGRRHLHNLLRNHIPSTNHPLSLHHHHPTHPHPQPQLPLPHPPLHPHLPPPLHRRLALHPRRLLPPLPHNILPPQATRVRNRITRRAQPNRHRRGSPPLVVGDS